MLIDFVKEVCNSLGQFEFIFNRLVLASALLLVWVANDGVSSLSVVAEEGEAAGQKGNGVSSDVDSSRISNAIEPLGPLLVSDSRSTKGDDFHIFKLFRSLDINKADGSEATTQADTGNNESLGVYMFSKTTDHIRSDLGPHTVVFTLDFASLRSLFVLDLNGDKSTWNAQRISCQTFLRLAVYRKARTVYSS